MIRIAKTVGTRRRPPLGSFFFAGRGFHPFPASVHRPANKSQAPNKKGGKNFRKQKKGIRNQATVVVKILTVACNEQIEDKSGFETVQMLLHSGIVNAQEFVGRGHHVDAIGLTLGAFPVHELVHWLVSR